MKKELGIFILLVFLCVVVAAINPRFLNPTNLQNMGRLIGAFGIFSLGLGLVVITSGIELSVGSMMALLGVVLSMMLMQWGWISWLAILVCICLTMALGFIHGLLVTRV